MNISVATIPLVIMASGIVEKVDYFLEFVIQFWGGLITIAFRLQQYSNKKVLCIIVENTSSSL